MKNTQLYQYIYHTHTHTNMHTHTQTHTHNQKTGRRKDHLRPKPEPAEGHQIALLRFQNQIIQRQESRFQSDPESRA